MATALARAPELRLAPGTALRTQIEAAIEAALDTAHRLIALLDDEDGDACRETEEADQPAAEWTGHGAARFNIAILEAA